MHFDLVSHAYCEQQKADRELRSARRDRKGEKYGSHADDSDWLVSLGQSNFIFDWQATTGEFGERAGSLPTCSGPRSLGTLSLR